MAKEEKCDVFISYRRKVGAALANFVRTTLVKSGRTVFLDVHEHMTGTFWAQVLQKKIAEARVFVLILNDRSFIRPQADHVTDWFCEEIIWAVKCRKPIVPFCDCGFDWDENPVPNKLSWLPDIGCAKFDATLVEESLGRLVDTVKNPNLLTDYERIQGIIDGTSRIWYLLTSRNTPQSIAEDVLLWKVANGKIDPTVRVRNDEMNFWAEIGTIAPFRDAFSGSGRSGDTDVSDLPDPPRKFSTQSENFAPGTRRVQTVRGVEYAFRWCPPGGFIMGGDGALCEKPAHRVRHTCGFWLLETPVTQQMWSSILGSRPSRGSCGDLLPVENINWNEANEFCRVLSENGLDCQLPTEAQWEYACRAGTTGDYAGTLREMAWCGGTSIHPVGQKKGNVWGLRDMHGNVREWCFDRFDSYYYSNSPLEDPEGPKHGLSRVVRGGGSLDSPSDCRSASRGSLSRQNRDANVGFRIVYLP